MTHIAKLAAKRIREFADIADRLAARKIVVKALKFDSEFWEMQLQSETDVAKFLDHLCGPKGLPTAGPVVTRVCWDGRDKYLTIERSPTRALSAPNQWRPIECKRVFDDPQSELLPYVEQFLVENIA